MNKVSDRRTPWPELVLLVLAVAAGLTAGKLDYDAIGTACAWICAFSVVAALVTVFLSPYGSVVQLGVIAVGVVAATYAIWWYQQHQNEPDFLSPVLIGYIGGGVAVSGLFTIAFRSMRSAANSKSL